MQIYLVGGAVRDQLLGFPIKERDWVVVGATPQQLLDLGYKPVGKDFPVFLHPETHEEFALARTERKTGPGYKGFQVYAAPDVTLEQDLQRRDLTINAIARGITGKIIDPYHGQEDLQNRLLRHVSPAFSEDPVRILRVARFAARFADFTIHPDTQALMQHMVQQGEVNALVAERVWQEWQRALMEPHPEKFFSTLQNCGALAILLPEWQNNTLELHALMRATAQNAPALVRFAVLFYLLTPEQIRAICQRYRIPRDYMDLATLVAMHYQNYQNIGQLNVNQLLQLFEQLDAFRRPERISLYTAASAAIANTAQYTPQLQAAYQAAKSVTTKDLAIQHMAGEAIKQLLRERRLMAIQSILRS